jgi:hypothetical protein
MTSRTVWVLSLWIAWASVPAATASEGGAQDALPESPARLLEQAFDVRYDVDLAQILSLEVRIRGKTIYRQNLELASKRIDGRLHALGRYREPSELRGTAVLIIETAERNDDQFIYLPSMRRTRRISSAQRIDSFLGTDLSYEDLERPRFEDYALEFGPPASVEGESVTTIVGRPRANAGYERVEFLVAKRDAAILETRHFKRSAATPFKITRFPRADIRAEAGRLIPTRILVESPGRGSQTEARSERLLVNPELESSLFTLAVLESARPIPGLER